jgi:hypothetical protein
MFGVKVIVDFFTISSLSSNSSTTKAVQIIESSVALTAIDGATRLAIELLAGSNPEMQFKTKTKYQLSSSRRMST